MRLVIIAGTVAMLLALLGTPLLIRFLQGRGYAQAIRESHDGINYPEHSGKKGTPSMGGIAIVGSVVGGYAAAHPCVGCAEQGSQVAWLQFCGRSDLLFIHAGGGSGE